MNRRRWIYLVIGVTIGVPVVIELLTLVGMIRVGFFAGEKPQRTGLTGTERRRIGTGDTVSLTSKMMFTVRTVQIRARRDGWVFHLDAEIRNETPHDIRLLCRHVRLDSGRTIRIERPVSVESGAKRKLNLRTELPPGTEPTALAVAWFRSDHRSEPTGERVLRFRKIPVRSGS